MTDAVESIAKKLLLGHVNFFLGSAASVPHPAKDWLGTGMPPAAGQLRLWLLEMSLKLNCNDDGLSPGERTIFGERGGSLAEVASYFELTDRQIYIDSLRRAFKATAASGKYQSNATEQCIPELIAESIERARKQSLLADLPCQYPVIMTTNFDEFIEDKLEERRIPHRVFVLSEGNPHKLRETKSSYVPKELTASNLKSSKAIEHAVHVLKLHGQVGVNDADPSKVVMSESDYIRYLIDTPVDRLMPFEALKSAIDNRACLFLGYSFNDWNMRALLRYLWPSGRRHGTARWAVALGFSPYQKLFLEKEFGVESISNDLGQFCAEIKGAWTKDARPS